jgi:hypothetical protein
MVGCGATPAPSPTPQREDTLLPRATSEASADRHYEPSGGFSYIPPLGWELVESPRIQYKIARERDAAGFAGNLNVIDEEFSGSLDEYVATSLKNMSTFFDGYRQISQEEFQPADGSPSVRVVVENVQQGRLLRQTFYFFGTESQKYVVACTRLAEAGEEFDAVCEQSVKTFRIESE